MNRRVLIVAAFLLLAVGVRAYVSITPPPPVRRDLRELPRQIGQWTVVSDQQLSEEVQSVLKADDYVLRRYHNASGQTVDLFIAYYKTQKAGESMHSPKNCLPGAGWTPVVNDTVPIDPAKPRETRINRYVIEKDSNQALALYWYQASGRVIASEYAGKFYLVFDALKTGRRDGAIVRVMVNLPKGENPDSQLNLGRDFARELLPILPSHLPK